MVAAHDQAVDQLLARQVTDPASPWRGGIVDQYGLFHGSGPTALILNYTLSLALEGSRHRGSSGRLMDHLRLAAAFLDRKLTPDGNIDSLITNFNSPADTAFAMDHLAPALRLARATKGLADAAALIQPLVERTAGGVLRGGVHTPNHRWVMCSALAQAHSVLPHPAYVKRVDEWLAETIDIDSDGQYSERSTVVYNGIVNRALCTVALRLNRPELLDPVRRNLAALLYLLHPDYEVVTEISRRQDLNQRGTLGNYWLPLRLLAQRDGNGMYETLARRINPGPALLLEYPELCVGGPMPQAVPDQYERPFPASRLVRIRRGATSATLLTGGNSRLFTLRRGEAIITAVRLAGAFFGKGQFVPTASGRDGRAYTWSQSLDAGYYQPFGDGTVQPVGVEEWYQLRSKRRRTEVSKVEYAARLEEREDGFRLSFSARGTNDLPVALEINLDGKDGRLEGCEPVVNAPAGSVLLPAGRTATWTVGSNVIRIGPGRADHQYTQIRGAQPKLGGTSIYLTAFAPFEHTLEFRFT